MVEEKLNIMPEAESNDSLELIRLQNTLADLMRQQESIIKNCDTQGIDINSPETKNLLDSLAEQVAEINNQIEEESSKIHSLKEAA